MRQGRVFHKKTMLFFRINFEEHKFDFTKTIRLLALIFYEAIENFHLVYILSL